MLATKNSLLCNECGKEIEVKKGSGRRPKYCSASCRVKACRTGSNKVSRSRKTLEQKQAELKARQSQPEEKPAAKSIANLIAAPRGIALNPKGRPGKKVITDPAKRTLDLVCPDEWLKGELALFKGKKMTIAEVIAIQMCYHAATGTRNPGLKDATELMNRSEGKVPLPVTAKEPDRDTSYTGLSDEELNDELRKLAVKMHNFFPQGASKPN